MLALLWGGGGGSRLGKRLVLTSSRLFHCRRFTGFVWNYQGGGCFVSWALSADGEGRTNNSPCIVFSAVILLGVLVEERFPSFAVGSALAEQSIVPWLKFFPETANKTPFSPARRRASVPLYPRGPGNRCHLCSRL